MCKDRGGMLYKSFAFIQVIKSALYNVEILHKMLIFMYSKYYDGYY